MAAGDEKQGKGGASAPPDSAKATEPKLSDFYVVGPGSVRVDGETYPAGASVQLSAEVAASLGAEVAPGKAPPAPADPSARKHGKYRVVGPGSIVVGGKFHHAGDVVDLDEKRARELGEHVREA